MDVEAAGGEGDLLQELVEGPSVGFEGAVGPGFEDGRAEGGEVEVGGWRRWRAGREGGQTELRVLALGAERGVDRDGVGLVDQARGDLCGGLADAEVEVGDLGFEGGAGFEVDPIVWTKGTEI